MAGVYSFNLVANNGPGGSAPNALILSENRVHRTRDGKWARFYAYGDGRIVEAVSDDGNFESWEKQH